MYTKCENINLNKMCVFEPLCADGAFEEGIVRHSLGYICTQNCQVSYSHRVHRRVEMKSGGVYLPSQMEPTVHRNFVRDGNWSERG
jgi:hypothetical protein